jgi:hypothetical protein
MSAVRALRQELPFIAVILIVGGGLLLLSVASAHWFRGVLLIAAGFGLAAILRLILPDHRAGLLRVRRRSFDVFCFATVSVLAVIFGVLLPRA